MEKESLLGTEKIFSGTEKVDAEFCREEWISACRFHEISEAEVFDLIFLKAAQQKSAVALLDLDSTLYDVGLRSYQILQEWANSKRSSDFAQTRSAVLQMQKEDIRYSVSDTFQNIRLHSKHPEWESAVQSAQEFWFERFFTNAYLPFDQAYPGAADFVQKLYERGATVIYLTGRDEPGMGDATRSNLLRDQFPWDKKNTHLLMKPSFHQPDLDHKLAAANYIRKQGSLVASFENEPPNVVALSKKFPEAMHVFVDTVCSDVPAMPHHGLYRIKRFS